MNKKKLAVLIACAVVVIGGAVAAIPLVNYIQSKNVDDTITSTTASTTEEWSYEDFSYVEPVTDEDGDDVTDNSGHVLTTIRKVTQTVKKTTAKATTKKVTTTKKKPATVKPTTGTTKVTTTKGDIWSKVDGALDDETGDVLLGYSYNSAGDYYYTDDKNCWQKDFGYNEVYDMAAQFTIMFIDCVRVRFTYGDYDWMIQLWKGQYGWLFVGAEIGVYTCEIGKNTNAESDINHYDCAYENMLPMELTLYWQSTPGGKYEYQFSRPYTDYWWCTGFKIGTLNKMSSPRKELKLYAHMTFLSDEMAQLFTAGMLKSGFVAVDGKGTGMKKDSIYTEGKDVYFMWVEKVNSTYNNYKPPEKVTTTQTTQTTTQVSTTINAKPE